MVRGLLKEPNRMKRWWKWIVAALVVVLLARGLAATRALGAPAQQQTQAQAATAKSP
jgi:hypothetical protein